jgi:hypothetical protein
MLARLVGALAPRALRAGRKGSSGPRRLARRFGALARLAIHLVLVFFVPLRIFFGLFRVGSALAFAGYDHPGNPREVGGDAEQIETRR